MKVRTQIQLEQSDYQALKRLAQRRGISMSAAVRWLVRENVEGQTAAPEKIEAFRRSAGKIRGDARDGTVSRDHDRVLYSGDRR